jgi:hypothetical protein
MSTTGYAYVSYLMKIWQTGKIIWVGIEDASLLHNCTLAQLALARLIAQPQTNALMH